MDAAIATTERAAVGAPSAERSSRDAFANALPAGCALAADHHSLYETDTLRHGGTAAVVALPRSTDELSTLARAAFAHRMPLVVQGERTGLCGAAVPDRSGTQCVVSLKRMTRVRAFDPVNRSITVEAGVRLSEINRHVAEAGLCLPIDLGSDPCAGGLVGANAGGSRLIKYGDVRRNVLGIEAVLADAHGTVLDLLAPLRKNNAGLDLKQMFIGANGANGIVSAVSFALAPIEQSTHSVLLAFASYDAATRALVAFEAAFGDLLSAYEFMSATALQCALHALGDTQTPFPGVDVSCYALVEIASGMPRLDGLFEARSLEVTGALLDEGVIVDAAIASGERFWRLRDHLPLAVAADALPLSFDVSLSRGALAAFLDETARWMADAHPQLRYYEFGHFGDGGCHVIIAIPPDVLGMYGALKQIALRTELYERVRRAGGSFSAEHGVGPVNHAFYKRFTAASTRAASAAVQHALDARALVGRVRY
ncbi:FAD-binding oxidoreductase [Paraburkholderia xenovorans]|uniref:FAD-binding oxidoreductase n=1 Tax=Paraburkholderia xenovorans TaxID=36873 RepID=UPI0038BBA9C1